MQDSHNRVQWVYSSTNNQELEERYDQWAAEYDKDLAEEFEWNAPQTAVDLFVKHVPAGAKILDAGAGTGLVGECLAALGFQDLHAMDLSFGMLEEARGKDLYSDFQQMTLGEPLGYEDRLFRRRDQRGSVHHRARTGSRFRRVGADHETWRVHRV